jgi:hypothetical protein
MNLAAKVYTFLRSLGQAVALFPGRIGPSLAETKATFAPSRGSVRVFRIILLLLCASRAPLLAQDSQTPASEASPWEKGALQIGGLFATFRSDVSFGVDGARSGTINGEDLLGLDSTLTVFRVEAMYRPGASRRNQVDFTYAAYHRDGNATLSRDLTIGDDVFPVGAQVSTILNFDLIRGTYSYALLQNDTARIALGLGVYGVPVKYGINVQTSSGRTAVEGADTTLPLPALALRAEVQLIPKLFLMASLDGMYLELSNFRGSLLDANLGIEYRAWKHLGFGVGYNFLGVHAEGESSNSNYPGVNFIGSVDVQYSGLLFYAKASF